MTNLCWKIVQLRIRTLELFKKEYGGILNFFILIDDSGLNNIIFYYTVEVWSNEVAWTDTVLVEWDV